VFVDVGRDVGIRLVVERAFVHVSVVEPMNGSSRRTSSVVMTGSVIDMSMVDSMDCVSSLAAIGVLDGGGAVLVMVVCPSGVFAR
jgi:hypothetical protein